jgi:hypothetical protein
MLELLKSMQDEPRTHGTKMEQADLPRTYQDMLARMDANQARMGAKFEEAEIKRKADSEALTAKIEWTPTWSPCKKGWTLTKPN